MATPKPRLSPLEKLKKAANLQPIKREVELTNGDIFEFWSTPLTMAERERAQKQARSDDANAFALQLLLAKAQDQTGRKLFNAGEIDVLKNEVKDADLQNLMLAVINSEEELPDPKN